jgi:hypothetical protein
MNWNNKETELLLPVPKINQGNISPKELAKDPYSLSRLQNVN